MTTIPIQEVIQVLPEVLGAGGAGLNMGAIVITQNASVVPSGTLVSYPDLASVVTAFGPVVSTNESQIAEAYFAAWTNSTIKPASIGFFGAIMTTLGGLG
jgi:hypothetical protein